MKAILKNKLFLTIYAADILSNFGDTLYYMALMTYVISLPNANLALSAVSLSETLPMFFSFAIGVKADQVHRKIELILASLLVRVGLYVAVGLAMGFTPTLWIVLLASGLNFFSDLAGELENGLYAPVYLRIVPRDQQQETMGFRQTVGAITAIVFKASGDLLIGLFSYQLLAFFNAATFLVSFLVVLALKKIIDARLAADPIKTVEQATEKTNFFRQMWESSKLVLREIKGLPALRESMIIVPVLNALFGVLDTFYILTVSEDKSMLIGSLPFTQTVIAVVISVATILGGSLTMTVAKNWSITTLVRLSALSPVLTFLALLLHNTYFLLAVMFVTMVMVGIVNPKFRTLIVTSLPEERLATIGSGIDTYFTAGMLLSRLTVSALVAVLTATQLSSGFLVLAIAFALWVFMGNGRAGHSAA